MVEGAVAGDTGTVTPRPANIGVDDTHSNLVGKAYVKAPQPISIGVTNKTKIKLGKLKGLDALRALQVHDLVRIQALACKADLANSATPVQTATRIYAHHPKS